MMATKYSKRCYRSRGNWAELYRTWLESVGAPATLTNAACSCVHKHHITSFYFICFLDKILRSHRLKENGCSHFIRNTNWY